MTHEQPELPEPARLRRRRCWTSRRASSHNGDTSATIDLSTTQDRYLPGVVYFRTDIYAPEMVLHKTVTDVNGGDVNPGDVLQYDISSTNTGQSSAYDSRINDAIPANTAYLPGR